MLDQLDGRNGTGEFARRSVKNLSFILTASERGEDVHPVTQVVGVLLGIVVFPWERNAFTEVKRKRLASAEREGWPSWRTSGPLGEQNKVKTVGDLIKQVRHSVAHGHVRFDSDSRQLNQVIVTFENRGKSGNELQWSGSIRADDLASFCRLFSDSVADCVA